MQVSFSILDKLSSKPCRNFFQIKKPFLQRILVPFNNRRKYMVFTAAFPIILDSFKPKRVDTLVQRLEKLIYMSKHFSLRFVDGWLSGEQRLRLQVVHQLRKRGRVLGRMDCYKRELGISVRMEAVTLLVIKTAKGNVAK